MHFHLLEDFFSGDFFASNHTGAREKVLENKVSNC